MDKTKLILINHYASIPSWPGPTRNFDFSANLVKLGWRVTLLSCKFNHYLRDYLRNPPAVEQGVRLKWVWSTPYQGNSILRELNILFFSWLSFLRGLWAPAQIVITVTPPLESAFTGWLLARMKRVPFVLDLEDLWPDSIIAMGFSNRLVLSWLRFLEGFLYQHSDHILVVAAEMKNYLLKWGIPETKITIIPLGANLPEPSRPDQRNKIRLKYGWENDVIVAAYVGAHGPANALETLVKAAQALTENPKLKIVLFGDGSDKPRLQKLVRDLGLCNISLEDSVSPEMVPIILGAVDIGIASLKDTDTFKTVRPNKLYEYMAAGLPVVCCIDGEAARFVEEAGSGVSVKPEDPSGLAETLVQLSRNSEYRQKLGQNGSDYVKKAGDRAKLAAQMSQVLQKVNRG